MSRYAGIQRPGIANEFGGLLSAIVIRFDRSVPFVYRSGQWANGGAIANIIRLLFVVGDLLVELRFFSVFTVIVRVYVVQDSHSFHRSYRPATSTRLAHCREMCQRECRLWHSSFAICCLSLFVGRDEMPTSTGTWFNQRLGKAFGSESHQECCVASIYHSGILYVKRRRTLV